MKKAAKILVTGTVQGVFFRQFVKEHADKLKLTGYVRNLESGQLEVIAEGEGESIERLSNLIKQGNEHSQIRNVIVEERKWSGDFKDFKIMKF
jgi:acylphosphatase